MKRGGRALPSTGWCDQAGGLCPYIGPLWRHFHQLLNLRFHFKSDVLEGALVLVANCFSPNNCGLKERQHHRIICIKLECCVDIAMIQCVEVPGNGLLESMALVASMAIPLRPLSSATSHDRVRRPIRGGAFDAPGACRHPGSCLSLLTAVCMSGEMTRDLQKS